MNLQEWCNQNNAQELLTCYMNGGNPLPPEALGFSSGKVVRWTCPSCNLSWESSPNHMNRHRPGQSVCPYCTHERASYFYNAAILYPELEPLWDSDANKRTLECYTPGSKQPAVWKCERGHSWTRPICDQVDALLRRRNNNAATNINLCPYCANQRASVGYNLELLFPELSLEWDYCSNGSLSPRDVMPYSSLKVHWICLFNPTHKWTDRIANRSILLRGCPICAKQFRTSYTARALCYYLRRNAIDCVIEKPAGNYHIDIAIHASLSTPVALEIDSHYYHRTPEAQVRDNAKDIYLKKLGYQVIRIRDDPAYTGKPIWVENTILYPYSEQYTSLNALSEFLVGFFTNQQITADHVRDHWKLEQMFYHDRKLRSLAVQYPSLAAQWSPNNQESPDFVLPGTQKTVLWICPICNKEFRTRIINRTTHKSGCPYCSNRILTPQTSLQGQFPQIADEWYAERNAPLLPEAVAPHSRRKVWWKCRNGHVWQASIDMRTRSKQTGCPYCTGRLVTADRSLGVRRPILISFWHTEKNSQSIFETAPYSNKTYWWKCENGHEWQTSPQKLSKCSDAHICPYCAGRRPFLENEHKNAK